MLKDDHTRDPQRCRVFPDKISSDAYVGKRGERHFFNVPNSNYIEMRLHTGDGRKGGHLITATSGLIGVNAVVVNIESVNIPNGVNPNDGVTIAHGFGYYPIVQVLDNDQSPPELVEVEVEHTDINAVKLTSNPPITNATVLLR